MPNPAAAMTLKAGQPDLPGYLNKPLTLLMVAVLVASTAWLGVSLTGGTGQIAVIWISNGLLAGIVLTSPRRDWPWLLASGYIGNVGINLLLGDAPLLALLLASCNTLEIAIGCAITGMAGKLDDLGWHFYLKFLAGCVVIGPLVAAFAASMILAIAKGAPPLDVMRLWFAADAVGMVTFAPLLLNLRTTDFTKLLNRGGVVRATAVLAAVALVTALVFYQTSYNVRFLVTGALILSAFQLRRVGLSIAICVFALIAVGMIEYQGTQVILAADAIRQKVMELQFYIMATTLITLPVAIIVERSAKLKQQVDAVNLELRELSLTDKLTKLSNRRAFDDMLEREWKIGLRNRSHLSLLIIDVDHFKAYNDTYGHSAGDACLAGVGRLLGGIVFRPSDMVARIGGEEFAVILPGTNGPGAVEVAERIRDAVFAAHILAASSSFERVTVSIGVGTTIPAGYDTMTTLFDIADAYLYQAKQNGRNRVEGKEPKVDSTAPPATERRELQKVATRPVLKTFRPRG